MEDYDLVTDVKPYISPKKSTFKLDLNQANLSETDMVYPYVSYQRTGHERQILPSDNIKMNADGIAVNCNISNCDNLAIRPQPHVKRQRKTNYTLLYIILLVIIIMLIPYLIMWLREKN